MSYLCHGCGTVIEDDIESFCHECKATPEPSADVVVPMIPDYLKIAEGLQELSQLMLDQRGVKRTEKAEELWESMRGEELAIYSAFLAQTCAPIIEAEVQRRLADANRQ